MTGPGIGPADDQRALMRRALHELQRAQQRIAELEGRQQEPLAIVGAACELPGGLHDPAALWQFLQRGGDATAPIPPDRWDVERFHHPEPGRPGRIAPRRGAFLEHIDRFDAAFFGIAPGEAELMDPQHRLLLEVAWHAFEDAGVPLDQARQAPVGVFVGISTTDWSYRLVQEVPPDQVTGHMGTGTSQAVAAGRIAYSLDLKGPCLALDTACSSSLVALHLAGQSLRAGECEFALVAGVNVMLSPLTSAAFSHARMLAPDGRCKTFAAAADGYARGEGAVALLLTRASLAAARELPVRALVLGTAVNQDGRSAGLTVPSGPAQTAVVQQALAAAGVRAEDVFAVEAHGTGTPLGDPIELQALAAVFAGRDRARPVYVGSVKTNFGHTEAAAGALAVIKAALQVQHGAVAPHLHFDAPNPHVPWSSLPFVVPTSVLPWPARPRRCGVSSFGFSGTNAHAVIGDAAASPRQPPAAAAAALALPISAADADAFAALARLWAAALGEDAAATRDLVWTAAAGRAPLRLRGVALGGSAAELARALRTLTPGSVVGTSPDAALAAAAQAFARGEPADLAAPLRPLGGRVAKAPLYPFQRRRFWYENPERANAVAQLLVSELVPVPATAAAPASAWTLSGQVPAAVSTALTAVTGSTASEPGAATHLCWSPPPATTADGISAAVQELIALARRLAGQPHPPRLTVLLTQAESAAAAVATPASSPRDLALRAALRALAAEQPALRPRWVAAERGAAPAAIAGALTAAGKEDEIVVGVGGLQAVRFARLGAVATAPPQWRRDGSYLLTGGSGAFGATLAVWLLEHGAGHVVLASRTARVPAAVQQSAAQHGRQATAIALDATDATAVAAAVQRLASAPLPLRGLFHLAAVLDDALLADLTEARAERALGAKLRGAFHLHAATAGLPLDAFVCVSSVAAWLGSEGQIAYAAANGGVEGLCAWRRSLGLPALALALGPLQGDGMARSAVARQRFAAHGIRPMQPAAALAALGQAMASGRPVVAALDADWRQLAAALGTAAPPRLLPLLPAGAAATDERNALLQMPAAPRRQRLLDLVSGLAAELLGQPASGCRGDVPLTTLGLDSLLAVDLRHRLRQATGIELPLATLLGGRGCDGVADALATALTAAPADADLLAFVAGLSDADARALLRREGQAQ